MTLMQLFRRPLAIAYLASESSENGPNKQAKWRQNIQEFCLRILHDAIRIFKGGLCASRVSCAQLIAGPKWIWTFDSLWTGSFRLPKISWKEPLWKISGEVISQWSVRGSVLTTTTFLFCAVIVGRGKWLHFKIPWCWWGRHWHTLSLHLFA